MAERVETNDTLPVVKEKTADQILDSLGFDATGQTLIPLNGKPTVNHMNMAGNFALEKFRVLKAINESIARSMADHVRTRFYRDRNNYDMAYEIGMALVYAALSIDGGSDFRSEMAEFNQAQFKSFEKGLAEAKTRPSRSSILDEVVYGCPIPTGYQPQLTRLVDLAAEGIYVVTYANKVRVGAGAMYSGLKGAFGEVGTLEHTRRHRMASHQIELAINGAGAGGHILAAAPQKLLAPPPSTP